MITIRQATLLDLLNFAPLGIRYSEEAGKHNNFPFNLDRTLHCAGQTIVSDEGCFLLAYDEGKPVGFLWGGCHSLPWSKAKLAVDTILYVVPESRSTSVGYRLMKEWEEWATNQGAVEVQISIASGIHEEKSITFFNKLGYSHTGTQYRKEIKHGIKP